MALNYYFVFIRGDDKYSFFTHTYEQAVEQKQKIEKELGIELVICKRKGQNDGLKSTLYIPNRK